MTGEGLPRGILDELRAAIAAHPFCVGIPAPHIDAMAEGAAVLRLPAGAFVLRRGAVADAFYLLLDGTVALEVADPGGGPLVLETLHAGDALGWSWLFPARTWQFDALCVTDVEALAMDAGHLRELVDADGDFGRDLVLRIGRVVVDRLVHARAQLVAVHQHDHRPAPGPNAPATDRTG